MTDDFKLSTEHQTIKIADLLDKIQQLESDLEHSASKRAVAEEQLKEFKQQHALMMIQLETVMDMIELEVEEHWNHAQRNGAAKLWRAMLAHILNRYTIKPTRQGFTTPPDERDVEDIPF